MKKSIFILVISVLLLNACKKVITNNITEEEIYTAPSIKIIGNWKAVFNNSNADLKYVSFNADKPFETVYYTQNGLNSRYDYAYFATDKYVYSNSLGTYIYSFSGDTLILNSSETKVAYKFIPTNDVAILENWVGNIAITRSIMLEDNILSGGNDGFGFNGDFIYFYSSPFVNNNIYQLNKLNSKLTYSMAVTSNYSVFYNSSNNTLYNANLYGSEKMFKTNGLNIGSKTDLSTNALSSINSISLNSSSNTIYAYSSSNQKLFSGTDGGNFNQLFDFNIPQISIYFNSVVYLGSDEFLGLVNNSVVRFKIAPTFSIIKTYYNIDLQNSSIYNIAVNGADIWLSLYNYNDSKNYFKKITLN